MTSRAAHSIAIVDSSPAEPVSLELMRQHCRCFVTDEDDLLREYLQTARELVEGQTGLCLVRKTIRETFRAWPCGRLLELHSWPIVSVETIDYIDENGDEQSLTVDTDYRVHLDHQPAFISLVQNAEWPSLEPDRLDAITVTYTAGYDPSGTAAPKPAGQAILLLAAHWYRNRESVVVGTINSELADGVERLLNLITDKRYP